MAKKNDDVAVAEQPKSQVPATGNEELNLEQLAGMLPKMKVGQSVTGEYLAFESGDENRVVFMGLKKIKKKGNVESLPEDQQYTDAVRLLHEDGNTYVNADAVVVSSLRGAKVPSAYLIVCTGTKESKMGEYKTFDINELN